MAISDELTALATNLANAKDAVEAKGGTVGDTGLAGLADEIAGIPSGGGTSVTSVTIDNKATLASVTMNLDGTYQDYALQVTVLPAEAPQMIQVTSSNPTSAKVVDNGNGTYSIRAVYPGTSTITVTDYSGTKSDNFTMTVVMPVKSAKFPYAQTDVPTGGTRQIEILWTPTYSTDKSAVWTSDSQDITVSQSGLVTSTAGASTAATITATPNGLTPSTTLSCLVYPKTYTDNPDWVNIRAQVAQGNKPFPIGSEITINWRNWTSATAYTDYDYTWIVAHYGNVQDEENVWHPGMYLLSKYLVPHQNVSFETEGKVLATEQYAQDGVYYYGGSGSSYNTYTPLNLQTGDPVPYELYTNIYKTTLDFDGNMSYFSQSGFGIWSRSWLRQWLNSESEARGFDWQAVGISDTNGGASNRYGGFLRGFDADFLSVLKPTKVQTYQPRVLFNSKLDTTYDRIFLPSTEQMYFPYNSTYNHELDGMEGEAWDYIKQETGWTEPKTDSHACRQFKQINAQTSIAYGWLRTAYASYPNAEVYCYGSWNFYNAYKGSYRALPACVIY